MKRILLAVVAALSVSSVAQAGFFIEPFLGYAVSGEVSSDAGPDSDVSGMDFGARLGMTFGMFSVGAEYAKGTYETDESPSTEIDSTDLGVTLAFDFPIMIRLYATYFLDSTGDLGASGELTGDGGTRIGVGYTGLPFVNINVEMVTRSYDKIDSTSFDAEVTTTQIGLSVPLP